MSAQKDIASIVDVLEAYFLGLYHADSEILADVFHPDARYVNMVDDAYMNYSMQEYFTKVDQRTPPASSDAPRKEKIMSIEFGGERMAFVKLTMTMFGREYLDFLTLTHDRLGWRIMSKVFTYIPKSKED